MKNISLLILIIFILLLSQGCNEGSPIEPVTSQVVVRAYLYANEPITDIQISGVLPLGSTDTVPPPINNAQVSLIKDGKEYGLLHSAGDSGYYHYTGKDLTVQTGDNFEIRVTYNGITASATTSVPSPPSNVQISADTIYFSTTSDMSTFRLDTNRIQVTWSATASSLYYVTIENIDPNPEDIYTNTGNFFPGMRGRVMSAPISTNIYNVTRRSITSYGKHQIRVYQINQEYADLFRSRQQDSRDLNEPLTNVKNGLGIFSAFNNSSVYFYVLKQ